MELIQNFVIDLEKKNLFNLAIINEINNFISNKLKLILSKYIIKNNKCYILQELVIFGIQLEKSINSKDIISVQLSTFTNLLNPIILKLKVSL